MSSSSRRNLIVTLTLILSLLSGCSRDPNVRKQKYLQSGQNYVEHGKYREAVVEFSNAIKADPNFAEAHLELAEAYLQLHDGDRAFRELARTVELQPGNYRAQLELTNLLIVNHEFEPARQKLDALLQQRPNDPAVHTTQSSLLAAQGNIPGAIAEMQKTVALSPERWEAYLSLALLQSSNNQPEAAEANFNKVIELNPKAVQARLLLGNYYQAHNRFSEAEQQFQAAIALDPSSADPRAAQARLYLAEGKRADAEQLLIQAKHDLPNNPAAYRLLGEFYFLDGELDKAAAEYASLYQQHPEDLQLKKNYIGLLIQTKRFPEARKLDDEILKASPNDDDALVYQAQMQISDGDVNDAAQKLETVIKNSPKNSEGHYALGVAYEKLGYTERAESEWREALRLQPNLLDAARALASAAMQQGDANTLDEASSQLIVLQPAAPEGYALRALANINRKRYGQAETDIRKAIAIAPGSAFGYVQLGNLKLVQKQYEEAARAYQDALNRNPDSVDALRGLMNTRVAQNQTDKAIAAAHAQIAKSPTNSGFYDLLGTTLYFSKKELAEAETAFAKSVSLDQHNSDALFKLCEVQATKGELDQAIATAKQGLNDNPRNADLYVLLGRFYESKSDLPQAEAAYRSALNLNPEHPLASSDLAKLMLETGGNLDVALSLAQTARRGMPNSPAAADTLAWANYQKGAYQSAIGLLQEALSLQDKVRAPDNPEIHYHLGMAYAKNGQTALARQQLERALKLNPNATDVKKQLAQLKSS
ncbi:MAG: tetratricopeptide repeat protein [Terriglobales bacterium]